MRLQVSTDYAIRILQYLHINKDGVHTANTIAHATGITYPFFIKIANLLKKHGLVGAVQGRNGGYTLDKPADQISFYDVFLAVEGEMQISRCILADDHKCNRGTTLGVCRLRGFLCDMQNDMIARMSETKIVDLIHAVEDEKIVS